jgi:transcriptional regulator
LHVHVPRGLGAELHLANDDPQLADMRRTSRAVIEVDEVLSFSPSHWLDAENAAHADQYYRCAILRGEPQLDDARSAVACHLRELLERYQPEGSHAPVDETNALYTGYLDRLTVVRLITTDISTKFKLAQKASANARERIVGRLRESTREVDRATSEVIERAGARANS